jgi:hypothetical protein
MGQYGEPWRLSSTPGVLSGALVTDKLDDPAIAWIDSENVRGYGGALVAESIRPTSLERIMLCVNAMAGVSNDTLRAHIARGGYAEAVA